MLERRDDVNEATETVTDAAERQLITPRPPAPHSHQISTEFISREKTLEFPGMVLHIIHLHMCVCVWGGRGEGRGKEIFLLLKETHAHFNVHVHTHTHRVHARVCTHTDTWPLTEIKRTDSIVILAANTHS